MKCNWHFQDKEGLEGCEEGKEGLKPPTPISPGPLGSGREEKTSSQ